MSKILVFGNGSLSVAQQERRIAIEMAKLGHKVTLLCNENYRIFELGDLLTHPNLTILNMPFSGYRYDNLVLDEKPDICVGMDQSVCPFVSEYKSYEKIPGYCMFLDFPVHVINGQDLMNYNYQYAQRYYYWLQCSLELDGVFFNNGVAQEEYYKRYKKTSSLVFYAVMSDGYLDRFSEETPTKDYVFGCHRLIPYKGTDLLVKALKRLDYKYKQAFVSGDKNHLFILESLIKELSQPAEFFNKLSEPEKMFMFYNARLVVYPQITEWIGGMSIIEGWSVKTPGVCFDYPVLRELYQDCVVYAKPNSILDLREKIDMLYKDEAMQKEMAEKGYERYLQYFTPKNMAANMLEQMNV